MRAFAQANGLPTVASFRARDIIDNQAAEYVGALGVGADPALQRRIAGADLLLVVGDRLSEMVKPPKTLVSLPLGWASRNACHRMINCCTACV
jgi:acetolactate synthase-1/2/3 large subunit